MAGQGHDGFLLQGWAGGQVDLQALRGFPVRLPQEEAPHRLDQQRTHAPVADAVDAAQTPLAARTVFARTTAGVTADLFAIVKPPPVAHFGVLGGQGQVAQALGARLVLHAGLQCGVQFGELGFDGQDEFAQGGQHAHEPRIERGQFGPMPRAPPAVRQFEVGVFGGLAVAAVGQLAAGADQELAAAGLAEDTIVFFYSDHGPGLPRGKRFVYHSGLHVPLIVYIPEKWRHLAPPDYQPGGRSDRLVHFVDLAPTLLSLAGVKPPAWMHGRAFLGAHRAPAPSFNYGYRGRMDERYDLVRSVTDGRFVYLRNYLPHLPHGQHVAYMFETPITRVWKKLFDAGQLTPAQAHFWQPRPAEELYDLHTDPDEVVNLAGSPAHRAVLERLRAALREHLLSTRDLGFLPEAERERRRGTEAPAALGSDPQRYPLERLLDAAERASRPGTAAEAVLATGLNDPEPGIRYWAVMGHLIRGEAALRAAAAPLRRLLADEVPSVAIAAAGALGRFGGSEDLEPALATLLRHAQLDARAPLVAVEALNALDQLGPRVRPVLPALRALPALQPGIPDRLQAYVPRLLEKITALEPAG